MKVLKMFSSMMYKLWWEVEINIRVLCLLLSFWVIFNWVCLVYLEVSFFFYVINIEDVYIFWFLLYNLCMFS